MKLTVINVGYGDALLIEATGGYTALIDGGSMQASEFKGHPFRISTADYLRSRGLKRLDAVFITHIHEDHVSGLIPVLSEFTVDHLFVPYPTDPFLKGGTLFPNVNLPRSVSLYTTALNDYLKIIQNADSRDMTITVLKPGDILKLEDTLTISVLAPKSDIIDTYMKDLEQAWLSEDADKKIQLLAQLDRSSNQTSMMLKLETNGRAILAAADNIPGHWNEIPPSILQNINILKLPHHGQIDAIDPSIMRNMPLQYVITTAASDRRYNSANAEVYKQLDQLFPEGNKPEFLFSDERSYAPWFFQSEGFNAITLEIMDSGIICPEFIKIEKEKLP